MAMKLPTAGLPFPLKRLAALTVLLLTFADVSAQDSTALDSTVVYPAEYFAQFSPVNVNDMIDRVPGISVALNSGAASGGGSTSTTNNKVIGLNSTI